MKIHLHRIRLRLTGALRLDKHPGIPLEGALTAGLRDISCACRGAEAMDRCPVERRCALHRLARPRAEHFAALPKRFDTPPPPLVLRPRFGPGTFEPGAVLVVEAVVVAPTDDHLPWLLAAFAAAGRTGIGPMRRSDTRNARFEVVDAERVAPSSTATGTHGGESAAWRWPEDLAFEPLVGAERGCVVRYRSPTLVPRGGPRGSHEMELLVAALAGRASLLGLAYGGATVLPRAEVEALRAAASAVRVVGRECRWEAWDRHSGRQGRSFGVGGWTGGVRYAGDVRALVPLLRLGALLHVGPHAIRGLGEIGVEPLD